MWPAWYKPPTRSAPSIVDIVATAFGVSLVEMRGSARSRHIVAARWAAIAIMRDFRGMSYPAIGRVLGGRDQSTIQHGYHQRPYLFKRYPEFQDAHDIACARV